MLHLFVSFQSFVTVYAQENLTLSIKTVQTCSTV